MIYRSKPEVLIEAIQWNGSQESLDNICKIFTELVVNEYSYSVTVSYGSPHESKRFFIKQLYGQMEIISGSYIIKGPDGEYYSCKPDIFESRYDLKD